MYALVDCNNFYVSCERVFNPAIRNVPVVVLSNNDGCVVARSNEIKQAGIPMGAPYFKYRDQLRRMSAQVFSSNYELYGDMSRRVIQVLNEITDNLEVYSIDEAFLSFPDWSDQDLEDLGVHIRSTVLQQVGIPVSVGFAKTKTLAKVAAERAKKDIWRQGVCVLTDQHEINTILDQFAVADLWGIGRKYSIFLASYGVTSAGDFMRLHPEWVKKHLTIMGLRIWQELRGYVCYSLVDQIPAKKAIASTRSFGTIVTSKSELKEALALYATRASRKLRQQRSAAHYVQVFINTSRFRDDAYFRCMGVSLEYGTSYTPEIIKAAYTLLDRIFIPGKEYKKAGIILSGITPDSLIRYPLFGVVPDNHKHKRAMDAIDKVNGTFGKHTLQVAAAGIQKRWTLNADYRSKRFTTKWEEILRVR